MICGEALCSNEVRETTAVLKYWRYSVIQPGCVCVLHKDWHSYHAVVRFIQRVSLCEALQQSWKHETSCCLNTNLVLTISYIFVLKCTLQSVLLEPLLRTFQANYIYFLGFVSVSCGHELSSTCTLRFQFHDESALPERLVGNVG